MALLYVAEFFSIGGTADFNMPGAQVPPIAEQTITLSGTSAQVSNPFNKNTLFVRIHNDSTSAVCIAFGVNPTAQAGVNMRMNINTTEYFALPPGGGLKVAAINVTASALMGDTGSTGGGLPSNTFEDVYALMKVLADPQKSAQALEFLSTKADAAHADKVETTKQAQLAAADRQAAEAALADLAKQRQQFQTTVELHNDVAAQLDSRHQSLDDREKALDAREKELNALKPRYEQEAEDMKAAAFVQVQQAQDQLNRLLAEIAERKRIDDNDHNKAIADRQEVINQATSMLTQARRDSEEAKALLDEYNRRLHNLVNLAQGA